MSLLGFEIRDFGHGAIVSLYVHIYLYTNRWLINIVRLILLRLNSDYYRCAPPTAIIIIIDMFIIISTTIIINIITIIIAKDIIIIIIATLIVLISDYDIDVIYHQRRYLSQEKANARMIRWSRQFFKYFYVFRPQLLRLHNNYSSV